MKFDYLIFLLLFWKTGSVFTQFTHNEIKSIDSLKLITEGNYPDSSKLNALIEWDNLIYEYDTELDVEINQRIIEISEKGMNKSSLSPREIEIYLSSRGMACNNLGLVLVEYGNYKDALKNFQTSLQIAEHFKDSGKQANALNNIGMIYDHLKLPEKALDFYNQSMAYDNGDPNSMGAYYNNVGLCYYQLGDTLKAFESYEKSLVYSDSIKDFRGKGNTYSNLGLIRLNQNKLDDAILFYSLAIESYEYVDADDGIALAHKGKGISYFFQGDFVNAELNCRIGYQLATKSKSLSGQKESCDCLYSLFKKQGKTNLALEYHELYVLYRDSLESTAKNEEVLKLDFQFNLQQQRLKDSITYATQQHLDKVKYETNLERKQNFLYFLYAGISVSLLIVILIFRGYLRKKRDNDIIAKQKHEVEIQKHIVEEKNKEITDSINYAKRIQEAILPGHETLSKVLPESFIIYKPKDIVAGDFYWLEVVDNLIIFAVADCTGHGVPGAMVSVVCHNALNRAVNEFKLIDPGKILDKTRELVVETFESENSAVNKSASIIRDGMDISLCVLNKEKKILHFAGANNSIYIIRQKQLIETTADKQPIGKYAEEKDFTSKTIQLEFGDILYLYTDGYADQFGGPDGKKFKYKQLKELLTQNSGLLLKEQSEILTKTFESWKGNLEQVDDVCLMGVQI